MAFIDKVLSIVKKIPKGKVATYGLIAKKINSSPRAVGQALKKNPNLIIIPCHRVVMSNGKLGGYANGIKAKINLLKSEGVNTKELKKYFWKP